MLSPEFIVSQLRKSLRGASPQPFGSVVEPTVQTPSVASPSPSANALTPIGEILNPMARQPAQRQWITPPAFPSIDQSAARLSVQIPRFESSYPDGDQHDLMPVWQGQNRALGGMLGNGPAMNGETTAAAVPFPGPKSVKAARYAEKHALPGSAGKCYKYVKTALLRSGVVSDYIPGVPARGAGPQLERRGYTNVLDAPGMNIRSPYDAPPGSVLVYDPMPDTKRQSDRYGHIELRTDSGFASDYYDENARTGPATNGRTGRGRKLIGVYVSPD